MKKFCLSLFLFLLLGLILSGCAAQKETRGAEQPKKTSVTITDSTGKKVEVFRPVGKIVSITSGASEIIYALGGREKIAGRDSYSVFPAALKEIPEVAGSSYNPNIELIMQCKPDVVIADTMLSAENRSRLEAAGIPVLVVTTSGEDQETYRVIESLGVILDREQRAQELAAFMRRYNDLVKEKTADLPDDKKPLVFYEWNKPYCSASRQLSSHARLELAGGINIAADEPVKNPTLTPEWVAEKNPDIIVRMASREDTPEKMKALRDEIMNRPGLRKVKAVKEGKVYVTSWEIATGCRSVIGTLYWAKWFHPQLFADLDPEAVHREMLKKFFDQELTRTYVCP